MGLREEDRIRQLETMIQATVLPVTWRSNGGTVGDLGEHDGRLVVVQTEAGQAEVESLLAALRWTEAHPAAAWRHRRRHAGRRVRAARRGMTGRCR